MLFVYIFIFLSFAFFHISHSFHSQLGSWFRLKVIFTYNCSAKYFTFTFLFFFCFIKSLSVSNVTRKSRSYGILNKSQNTSTLSLAIICRLELLYSTKFLWPWKKFGYDSQTQLMKETDCFFKFSSLIDFSATLCLFF